MTKINMSLSHALQWAIRAIDNGKPEIAKQILEEDILPDVIKQEQKDAKTQIALEDYIEGKI